MSWWIWVTDMVPVALVLRWGAVRLIRLERRKWAAFPDPPPGKPDYAKIRRLELELGLRDPDPPMFKPTLTPLEQAGEHWVNDANAALRQAQAEAAKWQQCPVCLRRHAGRCAG